MLHFAESVRRWGPLVQVWLFQFERYNHGMVNATRNNKYAMASMIKHMRIRRWKGLRYQYCTSVDGDASIFSSGPPSVYSLIFQSVSFSTSIEGTSANAVTRTRGGELEYHEQDDHMHDDIIDQHDHDHAAELRSKVRFFCQF